jgi:signal transduction histidine kinase
VLISTPVILLCKKRPLFINQPLRMAEILLFLVLMYALSFIVFRKEPSLIYALIPFISWAAFRFGQHGVGITGLMMSGLAIYFTSKGFGPFVRESLNDSFLLLQFFVGNVIVTGLALAGVLTERKKTEQMKTEFISTISHELKTPLTAVKGSLEITQKAISESFSDEVKGLIRIAARNVERLRRLVNDLLDSQKLEVRKVDFVIKRVEIDSLIEQSIELNQFFSDQYEIEIVLVNKLPGVKVHVDSERIIQVMNNLISNAAKFSPSKSSIRISMLKRNHQIRVAVTDSGPGIPAEFQKNIFQKFSYSDSPGRRGREGTGLGLWISKTIIEKHSGRIGYEANPNGGTTFYFELPSI